MGFGIRLRRLWHLKLGVVACFALALLAGVWSVQRISLVPPSLTPRAMEMATASTHVVVDTPKSALLDQRQDTYSFEGLTQRAILLGNVIANGEVRASIAQRAGVSVDALQIAPPLTRNQPQARVETGTERHMSDIVKSTEQYRLSIQANPTVPVLDIYSQARTPETAAALANSAVDALRAYLAEVAEAEQTPTKDQIRLVQLGRATGAIVNEGVQWQVAFVAFLLTLAVSSATLIFLARVRDGWRLAAAAEIRAYEAQEPALPPR
jgi:hypothetical protein